MCIEKYPIPRIEDLFASLAGEQHFSKMDSSNAYLQMPVEEKSHKTLPLQHPRDCFATTDLLLESGHHQRFYLDDILITSQDRNQDKF